MTSGELIDLLGQFPSTMEVWLEDNNGPSPIQTAVGKPFAGYGPLCIVLS